MEFFDSYKVVLRWPDFNVHNLEINLPTMEDYVMVDPVDHNVIPRNKLNDPKASLSNTVPSLREDVESMHRSRLRGDPG